MCDLDDYDGESATVSRNTWRRARKSRTCGACKSAIRPGDRYLAHAHLYDGRWHSQTACAPCAEAWEAFAEAHHGAPYPPGDVDQVLSECIDNGDDGPARERWQAELAALNERARRAALVGAAS